MRQKRFLIYLLCQVIVLAGVLTIFKLTNDVRSASVEAGSLFVLLPVLMLWKEYKVAHTARKIFYFGVLQFWLLFALPIMGLRLSHWEASFSDLSLLGISGPTLHHLANPSYLIMMMCTLWSYLRREPAALGAGV